MTDTTEDTPSDTNAVDMAKGRLLLYWTVVLIPLAYGVYNTLMDSTSLFTG